MSTHKAKTKVVSGVGSSARTLFLSSSALTVAALIAWFPASAMAETAPWSDFTHEQGSISIDTAAPDRTNIRQHTQVYIGTSGHLSIPEGYTVDITQNNSSALFAAKSANGADPTRILGALRANGNVLVIDTNGVYFGEGSQVDVGGLVATTGSIGNDQIVNKPFGQYTIDNIGADPDARIELHGRVNVADAGLAAFVAPTVKNSGVISARVGKVAFASGERVTIDPYGDKLFEIEVPGKVAALIENSGTVSAEGGTVQMSTQTASHVVDNLINVKGVVTAASATQVGGKIILSAAGETARTQVSGKLDASGTSGGKVEVKGKAVILGEGSEVAADAAENGDGGHIAVWGDSYAVMGGSASARGDSASGKGGFVELSAAEGVGFNGLVDTSAANGQTGTFLIDPATINLGDFSLFDIGTLTDLKVDDQALANTLLFSNVHLWATDRIFTSSDFDISTWQGILPSIKGITNNDLTLSANTIDILHNITLGNGDLILRDALTTDSVFGFGLVTPSSDIDLETVNLDARILKRSGVGGVTSVAGDAQIEGSAGTVNVLSPSALINQAVELVQGGGLINVAAGSYNESVTVDRAATLLGAAGNASIINPNSPGFRVTADNVTVDGFAVNGASNPNGYGVWVDGADNARVVNNLITDSASSGVRVSNGGDNAWIENNRIENSGRDGVEILKGSDNTTISGNAIVSAARYGVSAEDNTQTRILGNTISDTVKDGIHALKTLSLRVADNSIHDIGRDGIRVDKSPDAEIVGNRLHSMYDSGIEVSGSPRVLVKNNKICAADGDGIQVSSSDDAVIKRNRMTSIDGDGLQVKGSSDVTIKKNYIRSVGDDGMDLENMFSSSVDRNEIDDAQDNGISVRNSDLISITGNVISNALNAAVFVDPSSLIDVIGNTLTGSTFGVFFDDVGESSIGDNTIEDNQIGIRIDNSDGIDVYGNTIQNNLIYGLLASGGGYIPSISTFGFGGGGNGYINVENNVFRDNPIHARFESGLIDLTGLGNQFLNGDIALLFSPPFIYDDGYDYDCEGECDYQVSKFYSPFSTLALVDDDAPGYETFPTTPNPANYGGTIGAQFFSGQTTAFVKLENNAFLDPYTGEAIWHNGLDSTYDGAPAGLGGLIQPFATGGALTQAQFDFLEDMYIHYPDTFGTTGIFFFGFVPPSEAAGPDNIEDFFRQFGSFNPPASGLSVTITGLPSVGFGANFLAGISPAAGGGGQTPQNLANIEPAAGEGNETQPQNQQGGLNAIEPAAGDHEPCWTDAINAAGAGAPVNYSFGGTSEEDLEDTAACGSPG